ncbi:MAG: hypothetical protein FWC23_09415 [Chitinispirillia bacterium]|nr:hypothetical protein [Chitinispirillia bacterium]MCL2269386.1 hypothetical protein [Chitinispirillia bacterium]
MRNRIFVVFAVLFSVAAVFAAFSLEPPVIIMKADMGENMAWVDLAHTAADGAPVAVELVVYNREVDINGEPKVTNLIRSGEFTVYPAQLVLQAKQRVRVQIAYKAGHKVAADKAFVLHARQVPLPLSGEAESVQAALNTYMAYFTVIALETDRPGRLTFVSSRLLGEGTVEVIAENKSRGRVKPDEMVITIGAGRNRERIRNFSGRKNAIMPGEQRRFTFSYPYRKALSAREVSFEIDTK